MASFRGSAPDTIKPEASAVKIVRTLKLWFREGTSDKVYEVDLVDTEAADPEARFLVNFRYGRRGKMLQDGTKTSAPISRASAEKVFDSIVVAKMNKGYQRSDGAEAHAPVADPSTIAATTPDDGRTRALLAQLEACQRNPWPEEKRDRLFWRVGELRLNRATRALLALAHAIGPENASYSLVWALTRCAGAEALDILLAIAAKAREPLVCALADFAVISSAMGEQRRAPGQQNALPETISRAVGKLRGGSDIEPSPDLALPEQVRVDQAAKARRGEAVHILLGALTDFAQADPVRTGEVMTKLYLLAQSDPVLHETLVEVVKRLPARPPYVPGLRRLFKYAEMIDDAAMFGATAHRFETAKPMYREMLWRSRNEAYIPELGSGPGRWGSYPLTHLDGAPDAKTAMSVATAHYLKRRIWRALRKRAKSGQESYLALATAYLLAFTQADTVEPTTLTFYHYHYSEYRREDRKRYTSLPRAWSVGQIMHRHNEHVLLNAGSLGYNFATEQTEQIDAGEAFPDAWRDHPDYVRRIVLEAGCEQVAEFGLRLLREQVKNFEGDASRQVFSTEMLELMLASPFDAVVQFAFEQVQKIFVLGESDAALLAALLTSALPQAREIAVRHIEKDSVAPWNDLRLSFIAATSPHADVQTPVLKWAADRPMPRETAETLAPQFAAWLLADAGAERVKHLRACLPLLWPAHDLPLEPETIGQLMAYGSAEVRAAGVAMLAVSNVDVGQLPDTLWQQLLNSDAPEIQAEGLRLLGRLNDEQLAERALLLAPMAAAPTSEVRRAVRPLLARLTARFPRLGDDLSARLIDALFQAAPEEADDTYTEDLVALFREALPGQMAALDANLVWRLLQAKAKGAQLLGSAAVTVRDPSIYSVRQLARLGNHSHVAVREWVMGAYKANPARFQRDAADAVLLVESQWEDAYNFAIATFDTWPEEVWRPDVLAVVADSTKPEVLAFARQVLRRTMKPGDASTQLIRLLEHPAASMHLLISEVLTAEAARDETVFAKLLPLSRIVLLQVHKGRVAKDRIGKFLHEEALRSPERAAAIAPIFTDLSLSAMERDRTRAVMALRDIENAWPGLLGQSAMSPMKPVALAVRTA